jgi:thiamine-phosphate pyrophosphorylase
MLGATARDAPTAKQAMLDGASYVGVGPCFHSSTKDGLPAPLGTSGLAQVTPFAPVIAIGGITLERVPSILAAGAHGVAVVAAVADAPDPARALADLLDAVSCSPGSFHPAGELDGGALAALSGGADVRGLDGSALAVSRGSGMHPRGGGPDGGEPGAKRP